MSRRRDVDAGVMQPVAEVRMHGGVPTIFVDGKPVYYNVAWTPHPTDEGWVCADTARIIAKETGIHLYSFETGSSRLWNPPGTIEWPGPGRGNTGPDNSFDFSMVQRQYQHVLDADPDAKFHIRLYVDMNEMMTGKHWVEHYPDERLVNHAGPQPEQSFASTVWREQVNAFIRSYVEHIESIGLSDRILAYQVNAGSTCEWFKYSLNVGTSCGDYSGPMLRHFRSWLRNRYENDVAALRDAWHNHEVTFDTATAPSPEQQLTTKHYCFRDPASERNVVDYLMAISDLSADLTIEFSATVKQACRRRSLAGLFFGYWFGFQLNSDYFRDTLEYPNDHTRLQRTGHLGLHRVLQSPDVDFFTSPLDYAFRGLGGHCSGMQPADAVARHGKIYLQENDHRDFHPTFVNYGACRNVDEFISVSRRMFSETFVKGQGVWSTTLAAHVQNANPEIAWGVLAHAEHLRGVVGSEKMVREAAMYQRIGELSLQLNRTPVSEICVLIDDESFYYQTYRKNLELPLIEWQNAQHLTRIGAPAEIHILNDLLEGRLRPYKLYIFLNAFHLNDARREKLKREIRRDGRVAVWLYASGILNRDLSLDHVTDLTDMNFSSTITPWGPFMNVVDFDHPITRDVPEDLFWGTDLNLSPTLWLRDPQVRVLANVIHAQGRSPAGMGVREFDAWKSVFISVPNVPAAVLRGLARYAGVHLYNDRGEVMFVSHDLIALQSLRGGEHTLRLPRRVRTVHELFSNRLIARDCDAFTVTLPARSTSLFYVGDDENIRL